MKKQLIFSTFLYFSILSLQNIYSQNDTKSSADKIHSKEVLTLKEIDALIKKKEYNEALSEISIYMATYPKDFDRAQKRVRFIMKSRFLYDTRAEKLVDTMKNDSENDEQKMDIIIQLEDHEENQTKTAVELTRQARKTLALRFYIDRYNKLMAAGYRLVAEENYKDAIKKFKEGFYLKPNDSDKYYTVENPDGVLVTYEKDITEPVDEHLQKVENLLPQFEYLQLDCQKAYEEFMASIKAKDFNRAKIANEKVQTSFRKYAKLRNSIQEEVKELRKIDKIANERNPKLADFTYITFALGFIVGDDSVAETGVLGTMDTFWNTRIENMKKELYSTIHSDLKEMIPESDTEKKDDKKNKEKEEKIKQDPKKIVEYTQNFSTLGGSIHKLHNEILKEDGTRFCDNFTEYNISMDFIGKFADDFDRTIKESAQLSNEVLNKNIEEIEDGNFIATKEFLNEHLDIAITYEKIMANAKDTSFVRKELGRENDYYLEKDVLAHPENYSSADLMKAMARKRKQDTTAGIQIEDEVLDFRDLLEYQQSISADNLTQSEDKAKKLWGGLATLFATNAEDAVDEYQLLFNRANSFYNGLEVFVAKKDDSDSENENENEKEEVIIRKYPREAKMVADKIISEIGDKNTDFKDWRKSFSAGEHYRNILPKYDSGTKSLDSSIKTMDDLLKKSKEISALSEVQIKLAERKLNEAEENFKKAQEALAKQDFTNARKHLDKASQDFAESFGIQESASLRIASDKKVRELSERIVREENELVIMEVRELINEAQDAYYDGNLDYSEKRLIIAQNRWSVTNTEKNEEIESLLEIVSTARKLQIGRKIKPTDPLYSDMSQLLSVANQLYEEGSTLIKQKKQEEAENILSLAKEKLEPIKLIYPLNEDAEFLRLKIEQVLSPENFEKGFKRLIDEANAKGNAEKLATLQVLHKIKPDYPGLGKQIETLEYDLGIKVRPVVPEKAKSQAQIAQEKEMQRQAEDLYTRANSIFASAGQNQERLKEANGLLDEIIRLYSRDRRNTLFRRATALKDRIQSRIGGTVVAVLTSEDEAEFQRAQNFVNRGNYDSANDILEKLWKKPAAQKSKKIIDLRKFVKNRL